MNFNPTVASKTTYTVKDNFSQPEGIKAPVAKLIEEHLEACFAVSERLKYDVSLMIGLEPSSSQTDSPAPDGYINAWVWRLGELRLQLEHISDKIASMHT